MNTPRFHACLLYICLLSLGAPAALAQSITPASDGTGTAVNVNGGQYDITGGTPSSDGINLFHSFERFGLTQAEIANFIADPAIQNILGRITGGSASVIDGLLQVSGSGANLYLINPAGILFGPNSVLNLDGSFTATTATGIGFGAGWLQAVGSSDYAALVGNPTGCAFAEGGGGAIANVGNLAVSPGETLTLVGGAVINTGTLTAPGGQITIQAVPGENLVRISQSGSLLSLELATLPEAAQNPAAQPLTAMDLPALLTGGSSGIAVNLDNTLTLPGSTVQVPGERGDAVVSGSLNVSGETGGALQVLGDRVAVVGADINASGTSSGGTVLIGGDYQGQGSVPTASRTYVDAGSSVSVDAQTAGDGGEAIVWADKAAQFYGSITARGGSESGDGGFVEVSGRESLDFQGTVDATAANGQTGTLLLDPNNITIVDGPNSPADLPSGGSQLLFTDFGTQDVTVNNGTLNTAQANVVLQAGNQITFAAPVSIAAPTVSLTAQANGDILVDAPITTNQGAITLLANEDGVGSGRVAISQVITTNGGDIRVEGDYEGTAAINGIATGGNGSLLSGGGDIVLQGTSNVQSGVSINAPVNSQGGGITIDSLNTAVGPGVGQVVNGTITSEGGNITITGSKPGNPDEGIFLFSDINAGSGTLTLTSDGFAFSGGKLLGNGNLVIQPLTPELDLVLGGNTGFLDASNLSGITDGFAVITIGRENGSGAITLAGNVAFTDPVVLRSPIGTGSINTSGFDISGSSSLTLQAGDAITLAAETQIASINEQPIDLTLTGDGDNTEEGSIRVDAVVETQGGKFSATGTSRQENIAGVFVNGKITTQGGEVTLVGVAQGAGELARGTIVNGPVSTQGGDITVTGTSSSGEGIVTFLPIDSGGGDIAFNGTSFGTGTFSRGIALVNSVDSQGGNISFTGSGAAAGISTFTSATSPSTVGTINVGAGNLTLTADSNLLQTAISGTGSLIIQPLNPNLILQLGGTGDAVTPFLSGDELALLSDGFSAITIGSQTGSGEIRLEGPVSFSDPVILSSPNGVIRVNNPISTSDNGSITLLGPATIAANIMTVNRPLSFGFPVTIGGNVTLNVGASAISFENALAAGNNSLTLTADEIDFKNSVTGTGDLTLQPATQNQPIVLVGSQLTSGLDLTASELQQLQSGFSAVTIGSSTGSGEIRLGGPLEVNNLVI
ncbi:MAG: filamentous hemagglutinin N-terminal domain-containing protein, partial [Cyanobacteria bacterium Co-bin13]|nr:filamentous hemagglutinin N-terminal domain-containing protein [Cyanobacteria bacterium Co-bin13]